MARQEAAAEALYVVPPPGAVPESHAGGCTADAEDRPLVGAAASAADVELGWAVTDAPHGADGSSQPGLELATGGGRATRGAAEVGSPKSPSRDLLRDFAEGLADDFRRNRRYALEWLVPLLLLLACAAVVALVENTVVIVAVATVACCCTGQHTSPLKLLYIISFKVARDGWANVPGTTVVFAAGLFLAATLLVAPSALMATGSGASPPPPCHFCAPTA